MMYQIKHTREGSARKHIWSILALAAAFGALFLLGSSFFVGSAASDSLSPFFRMGNFFYNSVSWMPKMIFSDKAALIEENKNLFEESEKNRLKAIDLETVMQENVKLREELGLKPEGPYISSAAIGKPPQTPLDSILLDKGKNDGVGEGDLVLASQRTLVGKIVEVSSNKSIMSLSSTVGEVSYGVVERTGEPVEAKGAGGGALEAKLPIDFDIVSGDKIIVSDSFSYLIATVGAVESDEASGFKSVFMSLPVNVSKMDVIFIRSSEQ